MINIYNIQTSFGLEVPDKISLNIYFSGCKNNKHCDRDKCQNKDLLSFKNGTHYTSFLRIIEKYLRQKNFIECVCFLGGEPLDQDLHSFQEITNYIRQIRQDILFYCYSGYDIEDKKDHILTYTNTLGFTDIFIGHFSENSNNQYWLYNTIN